MNATDLAALEEALGVDLPASYRTLLRRLARKPLLGPLAGLLCLDVERLIALNELVSGSHGPFAGLPEWPDDLLVVGEDGCGNYYAIRHEDDDTPVIFFDHEADELQQCASSLDEFCRLIATLEPFGQTVLHRGYRPPRSRPESTALVVPSFRGQPKWMTSWTAFVEEFASIAARNPGRPATVLKLNRAFGSRPVRWEGHVQEIDLGRYPFVRIAMPESRASAAFPRLGRLTLALRWAARGQPLGATVGDAGTPQVLTSPREWRKVRPGHVIEFLMMFAPGHKGDISCVAYHDFGDEPSDYSIQNCGVHVLSIGARSRPIPDSEW